jgi:glycosyltransferase involved in cell wall biosynthesis
LTLPAQATPRSVLILAPEPLGETVTGPVLRAVKLAEAVAEGCDVTLAAPAPSVFPEGRFRTLETGPQQNQRLARALSAHDVAVVQALPSPRQLLTARRHARRLVADMIAPLALELAEVGDEPATTRAVVRWRAHQMVAHIAVADLVLCTNEKQRDLVIGAGLAAGLLDGGASLQDRVVVVPHGVDPAPPRPGRSLLRANGFADDGDRVAVWGGGIWSWLDPLTAIRAVERLRPSRPDLKLAFVGLDHPNPAPRRAHAPLAAEAVAYVRDRGLEDTVAFRPRWLSRDDLFAHLRDADVGLSLSAPTLEGRYASRTRVLDYLTAGLPVVCTRGDTMAELVDRHELGRVVGVADVDGVASAVDALTRGEPRRVDNHGVLEPLIWRNVARPLLEFCLGEEPGVQRTWRSSLGVAARGYPAFLSAVWRTEGSPGLARAAARRAVSLARRD